MPRPLRNFSALTINAPGLLNRICSEVGICTAFDPERPPSVLPQVHKVTGLWDTGASKSAISPSVVERIGAHPVGSTRVSTAGGEKAATTYMVNMILPNQVGFSGVLVARLQDMVGFDTIIGMDIITAGDFAITNMRGRTCVTYRFPSVKRLDFVEEANEIRRAKQNKRRAKQKKGRRPR